MHSFVILDQRMVALTGLSISSNVIIISEHQFCLFQCSVRPAMKVYDCILLFLKVKCPLLVPVVFWALSSIMFWSHVGSRALGRAAGPQLREERQAFPHRRSWQRPLGACVCLHRIPPSPLTRPAPAVSFSHFPRLYAPEGRAGPISLGPSILL